LELVVPRFDGRLRQLSVRKADVTVDVVSCLVASQFPEWSGLEIRPVALDGRDNALQRVNAAGGPPAGAHSFNRGGPVATWDEQTRATIAELGDELDREGAMAVWEAALAAEWNGAMSGSTATSPAPTCCFATTGCAASSTSDAPRSATRPAISRQRGRCSRA
jgi:hypothetical protein